MKKTTTTTQTKPKKARSQKARSPKGQGERWSFSLGETEWGPFKTKGAKIDSRSLKAAARSTGMVGLGSRAIDIQRKMPRLSSSINENGNVVDVVSGTDFLAAVTSSDPSGNAAGDILYKQEISPSLFQETRLKQFADLYQRYRFRRIHFLYEPVANATQSGQVLGFADFDVDNQLTINSPENLSIAAAHQGEAITQIWEPMLFDMGQVFTFTDLYTEAGSSTDSDPRLSVQGVFYLISASAILAGLPLGNIYVDYEIEFSIPFLSSQVSASRVSHGYFQCMAFASTVNANVTTSAINVRSARGPVQSVDSSVSSQTLAWQNCRPGDVIWVMGVLNATSAAVTTTDTQVFTPTPLNCTINFLSCRQNWQASGVLTWNFSFYATVSDTVGSGLASVNWTNLWGGGLNYPMDVSWVMDPTMTSQRGLRRLAQERDRARLRQVEDKMAQLLARLELASSVMPPTKESTVVRAGLSRDLDPRDRSPDPSGTSVSPLGASEPVRAGGTLSSPSAFSAEGPSRGPFDRYH